MENIEIKEGSLAPDFTLPGSDDKQHKLSNYRGKKVVLYFYPKDNTLGCTNEAIGFKESLSNIEGLNGVVLGISRDSIASHKKFIEKHNLNFILLSDPEEVVCKLYDVIKEKNMYGKKVIGVERSTFIINEDGIIEKIFRKVKVNGHVENVTCSIEEL